MISIKSNAKSVVNFSFQICKINKNKKKSKNRKNKK